MDGMTINHIVSIDHGSCSILRGGAAQISAEACASIRTGVGLVLCVHCWEPACQLDLIHLRRNMPQ